MNENKGLKFSLIIPTYNAEQEILALLKSCYIQTYVPNEIIIIDSSSTDATYSLVSSLENVRVIQINQKDFDHGKTRDYGISLSQFPFVCFLTQDVVLANSKYFENLLKPFVDDKIAVVTGRQIAKLEHSLIQKYTREFNYPSFSMRKDKSLVPSLGIKTYSISDVCSAYRKEAYYAVGGFDYPIISNEDMMIAIKFINQGYSIYYQAEACIYHSHEYSLSREYKRNFDIGVSLAYYKDRLKNISVDNEGKLYVKYVIKRLMEKYHIILCIKFIVCCGVKFLGNRAGLQYEKLSKVQRIKKSNNRSFWK